MKTLRVTGVPEHFNLPWKKVIAKQPFISRGLKLEWIEESRGSGQMNLAIRNDETDIALILTESFLQDFENGSPSKMIGFQVLSPLVWGIHIYGKSLINSISQIKKPLFLVSRIGSGSQLMSYVLAKRENWNKANLNFEIVGNLQGALGKMTADKSELFLWEKFTTKPWVDSGEFKRIGEVPSPWPCFVMVASQKALNRFEELILELRDLVYQESQNLQTSNSTAEEISTHYNLKLEDVKLWLAQTQWAVNGEISVSGLKKAMNEMVDLGILKSELRLEEFLISEGIHLIS
ncbi:ABC transporter substrate-binding protein [Algoriphagus sp.]|uniref:ABC transporter substrate-binding protein n=1 Tax=Algoriphagus sp. TaxID=1872435 RepID=UPI0025D3DD83|nr:ABC transporter substrate-binding protein [Algoriphagus sp.]